VIALGAAKMTGIDEAHSGPTVAPSLYIPSGQPTTRPEPFPDPAGPKGPGPTAAPSTSKPAAPKPKTHKISLQAFPNQVGPNQRINFTGVYQGGEGARLQVQRFEGGWKDFPVSTSVSGGLFNTFITSGRQGMNRFRMVDKSSGRASNPVRVTIG
jgi:hypothetical protein